MATAAAKSPNSPVFGWIKHGSRLHRLGDVVDKKGPGEVIVIRIWIPFARAAFTSPSVADQSYCGELGSEVTWPAGFDRSRGVR